MKASESQANIFCDRLIEVYNEAKSESPSLKQKDIAIAVDIPAPDIHKYFAKKIKTLPDAYRIYSLANYFKVSQAWLMGLNVPKYDIITPNFDELIADVIKDEKLNITGSYGMGKSTLLRKSVAYTLTPKEQELKDLIENSKLSDEKLDVLIDMIKSWK